MDLESEDSPYFQRGPCLGWVFPVSEGKQLLLMGVPNVYGDGIQTVGEASSFVSSKLSHCLSRTPREALAFRLTMTTTIQNQ
jgi:hypothetical protein